MKKKNNQDKTTMTAREVAVLIEDLRSLFRIFGEDLSAVKNRVDTIFEEQGKLREEIFIIKVDINVIKGEIKEIKIRLDHLEKDIHLMRDDVKIFDRRIAHLEETSK